MPLLAVDKALLSVDSRIAIPSCSKPEMKESAIMSLEMGPSSNLVLVPALIKDVGGLYIFGNVSSVRNMCIARGNVLCTTDKYWATSERDSPDTSCESKRDIQESP